VSEQTDFKPKSVRRFKESHYILEKLSIHQGSAMIVNIYVLNVEALNFIKTNAAEYKGTDSSR
jgi:hypothetical protein